MRVSISKGFALFVLLLLSLVTFALTPTQAQASDYTQLLSNCTPPEFYTPYVVSVFTVFDINNDSLLDLNEMKIAYDTLTSTITYRYDDERAEPEPGTIIGDGRPGPDYFQKPEETLKEQAGDCEDFAILFASLLNYYGYIAFVGDIDCDGDGEVDHATCLLYAPESTADAVIELGLSDIVDVFETSPEEVAQKLHCELGEGFEDWVLIPIDGTYSEHFGYVSGAPIPELEYFLVDFYTVKDFMRMNPGAVPTPTTPEPITPGPTTPAPTAPLVVAIIIILLLRKRV